MYYFIGIIFTCVVILYCNKNIKSLKTYDFDEEDKKLAEESNTPYIKIECEEMRLNKGILSDNYLMIIISIIISSIFMFIKGNYIYTGFFTPVIPVLISLFFIDIRMKRIPDVYPLIISFFGLLALINVIFNTNSISIIYSNLLNAGLLFIIYFAIAVITGGMLGGGDIKLIASAGLFFSIGNLLQFLMYPYIVGGIQAVILMIFKRKKGKEMIAFAPSIIISIFIIAFL